MEISSTFAASDGNEYEIQMGRWSRRLAEPFLDFTGTANDEEVLDVGCGTGNLAFAIAQRAKAKSITGVDFSAAYVENAKSRNRAAEITFEVGDQFGWSSPQLLVESWVRRTAAPPVALIRLMSPWPFGSTCT